MTDKEKELQAEAIDYYRKQIASLEKENAELKDKLKNLESVAEVRLANWQKYEKELKSEKEYSATLRKEIDEYTDSHTLCTKYKELKTQAKEIILKLYNAGRDVLMCRTEEKAYENLSHAINDKEIEQFLNSLLANS